MVHSLFPERLTGSPNLKAASDWVVKQAAEWGLKNARLRDEKLAPFSNDQMPQLPAPTQ